MIHFACEICGSPSIAAPSEVHDAAPVRCGGCGVKLGSWREFKRATSRLIHDQAGREGWTGIIGSDPLCAPDRPSPRAERPRRDRARKKGPMENHGAEV